jgi:RNA polymerase sigma-70 factor (ECF subfamily)
MSSSKWDFVPNERDRLSSKTNSIIQSQEDSSPSDEQLIKSAQAGNIVDFDLVYERYYYKIYSFLARMLFDRRIAEELTQETFIKAWKALHTLRDPTKFLNWLYRIATHEVQNYFRHPGVLPRGPSNQILEDNEEVSISGPEELVEAQEHVKWALAHVAPEKCRACLILYHIQGRPITQIAEDLGIKQSSVRQYISSGLNQLKHLMEVDDTSREER